MGKWAYIQQENARVSILWAINPNFQFPFLLASSDSELFCPRSRVKMQSADVPLGENLALDDRSPSTLIEAGNTKRRAELSWKDRARAIFFYLHPALGKRDLRLTAKTFDLNSHTLNSWMTNKRVIPKWVPLVEDMEALDILESLPSATRQELLSTSASLGVVNYHSKVDLHRFQKYRHVNHHLNPPEDSHSTHHHHHHQTMMLDAHPNVEHPFLTPSTTSPGGSGSTHDFTSGPLEGTTESLQHHNVSSSLSFNAVGSVPHSSHVKANSKRLALDETKTLGRNRLYQEQEEFIAQTIRQAFESGDPLTKHDLRSTLLMNTPPHVQPFYQACCDPQSKSFPNYLNKFISRSLERLRFVQKKKVIVEKVPHDWRQRVENHVMNITERMKKAQVEAFVAIDEIFIRFHDDSSSSSSATNGSSQGIVEHHDASTSEEEPSLAANGESPSAGSPLGCIVILCLDLVSNQFLPPVVVFTGGPVFSEDEKEIWKHTFLAGGATVIESNTPWISGHTTITTLNHIRNFFPTKRIGTCLSFGYKVNIYLNI